MDAIFGKTGAQSAAVSLNGVEGINEEDEERERMEDDSDAEEDAPLLR